jgi:hypothetical protein
MARSSFLDIAAINSGASVLILEVSATSTQEGTSHGYDLSLAPAPA